jgi:hypothetical protein
MCEGQKIQRHPLPLAHPHPGCKAELSTLLRRGTFYFALTDLSCEFRPVSLSALLENATKFVPTTNSTDPADVQEIAVTAASA